MANNRNRRRVGSETAGRGRMTRGGPEFGFLLTDFSVSGAQMQIVDGESPTIGEQVSLEFVPPRLDGFDTPVRVTGKVRRISRHAGTDRCGVEWDSVRSPADGDALDEAYLEHFLMQET